MRTSLSDNTEYPDFCNLAVKDDKIFKGFRKNPIYCGVVETLNYKQGLKHLRIIINQTPELIDIFDDFRKNDTYGEPNVYDYGVYGKFSPTTLGYIKVLSDLKMFFGSLDNFKIIEIGGGYGGQCKIILDMFNISSYSIVDINPALRLAEKYLGKFHFKNINFLEQNDLDEAKECDLLISNYAFSECIRSVQEDYFKKVFKNSKRGYLIWNFLAPKERVNEFKIEELNKMIKGSKIIVARPDPFSESRIIIWNDNNNFSTLSFWFYFIVLGRIENAVFNFFPTLYMDIAIFLKKKLPSLYYKLKNIKTGR